MRFYIASSWKNASEVARLRERLREVGDEVFDFGEIEKREAKPCFSIKDKEEWDWLGGGDLPYVLVLEAFEQKFPEARLIIDENLKMIEWCDALILLFPCGIDAHVDYGVAKALGKLLILIGEQRERKVSPTHLWAELRFLNVEEFLNWYVDERGE